MRRVTLPRPSLGAHSATVSRAVAALPPVVLRARPSQELLIRVLQGVVLCQLLILGVILATAIAWALIAIPMTLIVLLFLREFEEARRDGRAGPRRSRKRLNAAPGDAARCLAARVPGTPL